MLFTSANGLLQLKKLTPNTIMVNGKPAPQQEMPMAHGAQIGFCGKDNVSTFLVFNLLLPEAHAASQADQQPGRQANKAEAQPRSQVSSQPSSQQSVGNQQPPTWWFTGPPTPHSLVCVQAFGYDVTARPLQMRTIGLAADTRLTIGRIHQPGFFEGLLGAEPAQRYLCCVSRTHLELTPAAGEPAGCFDVTNLSANPVALVGKGRLGKGERGTVRPGDCIDFFGGAADGSGGHVVYLKLGLERQRTQDMQVEVEPEASPTSKYRVPPTCSAPVEPAKAEERPPPSTPPARSSPRESEGSTASPLLPAAEEVTAQRTPRSGGPPAFWLTLCGSAVKDSFPQERRRLDGRGDGLTVGRAHQQALHTEAFDVELRQYLSRDHFRVECAADGSCRLVPVSSNPIWRVRRGRRTEAIRGDPALPLARGDVIQIFTGAEDCTPDGPGNLGTLFWIFQDPSGPQVRPDSVELPGQEEARPPVQQASLPTERRAGPKEKERGCVPSALHMFSGRSDVCASRERGTGRRAADEPRGHRSPGGSQGPLATGALRAPIPEEDEEEEHRSSLDLSFREINDKFAASGFKY